MYSWRGDEIFMGEGMFVFAKEPLSAACSA